MRQLCSRDAVTVYPEATIVEAARLMRARHVGAVIIISSDRRPLGILTDRDIVMHIAKDAERIMTLGVKDILTPDPIVAIETEDLETTLARMRRHGIRRIPIIDSKGHLVGVFALDDALKRISEELGDITNLIRAEQWHEEQHRS